jgi:hypothetical protein
MAAYDSDDNALSAGLSGLAFMIKASRTRPLLVAYHLYEHAIRYFSWGGVLLGLGVRLYVCWAVRDSVQRMNENNVRAGLTGGGCRRLSTAAEEFGLMIWFCGQIINDQAPEHFVVLRHG